MGTLTDSNGHFFLSHLSRLALCQWVWSQEGVVGVANCSSPRQEALAFPWSIPVATQPGMGMGPRPGKGMRLRWAWKLGQNYPGIYNTIYSGTSEIGHYE